MEAANGLTIDWDLPKGVSNVGTITARFGEESFTDRLDIARAKARGDFVDALCDRWPALNTD